MEKHSLAIETYGRDGALSVVVNGERAETRARTLGTLLLERGVAGERVATALNGRFVPVRDRDAAALATGDAIEIVSARQGG